MPLAVVLRSGVAPQRCPLSYTAAKISKVLETTKTFWKKIAKKQKVSHKVGHFKPLYNLSRERLLPKHYMRMGDITSSKTATALVHFVGCYEVGLTLQSEGVRKGSR